MRYSPTGQRCISIHSNTKAPTARRSKPVFWHRRIARSPAHRTFHPRRTLHRDGSCLPLRFPAARVPRFWRSLCKFSRLCRLRRAFARAIAGTTGRGVSITWVRWRLPSPGALTRTGWAYGDPLTGDLPPVGSSGHSAPLQGCDCRGGRNRFRDLYLSDAPDGIARDLGGRPHEGFPMSIAPRSPMTYAHRCTTPTLLLHGEEDLRCPISEAEQFFRALQDAWGARERVGAHTWAIPWAP